MNLKFMLLFAMVVTNLFYYQAQAITQITSDHQFGGVVASGQAVIAVGTNQQVLQLVALNASLNSLENGGSFPSARFCYAFIENIPQSAQQYQISGLMVLAFKNGNYIQIQAPVQLPTLTSRLQAFFNRIVRHLKC